MKIIDLKEEQIEDIENRLSSFDENYISYKMNGSTPVKDLVYQTIRR